METPEGTPAEGTETVPAVETKPVETPAVPISYIGDGGVLNRDAFGETGKHSAFDKYKTIDDLGKGVVNLSAVVGKKISEIAASEDPDIIAAFQKSVGVPDDISGYNVDPFEYPDGLKTEAIEARIEAYKPLFKELGISAEAGQKLIQSERERIAEAYSTATNAAKAELEEEFAELKKMWPGDKFDVNMDKGKRVLEALGLGDYAEDLASNPKWSKDVFDKLAPLISNDELIERVSTTSISSIADRLVQIEHDIDKFDGAQNDPKYKALLDERWGLLEKQSSMPRSA